jgi:hypothetical protein
MSIVERFPIRDVFQHVPISAHPVPVHKDRFLSNDIALKVKGAHGCTLTFSAHFICHHTTYAHTFCALVSLNILTRAVHITYPEDYLLVITEGQATNLANYNATNHPNPKSRKKPTNRNPRTIFSQRNPRTNNPIPT